MREAKRQYTKKWQSENRDKVNEQQRRWRDENREHMRAWRREYYKKNRAKIRASSKAERERNKGRVAETQRRYREANRAELTLKQRARTYGVSLADLQAFLAKHDDRCTVCRDEFDPNPKHRHIDHDHKTGKLRGVLCRHCNLALGNVRDSIERLELLIAYLRRHQ